MGQQVLAGLGHSARLYSNSLFGLAASLGLLWIFVPRMGLLGACLALAPAAAEDVPPTAALPAIFNGRDLEGWKAPAEPYWTAVDGVLVGRNDAEKKGSMLYTARDYGDVIFEAEVRWTGEIDSGFMLRRPEVQVQIGVSRSLKRDMTCSFYVGGYPEEAQAKLIQELDLEDQRLKRTLG